VAPRLHQISRENVLCALFLKSYARFFLFMFTCGLWIDVAGLESDS
jgi:hypothetical protein